MSTRGRCPLQNKARGTSHNEDNDHELISSIYWYNLHAAQPLSFSIYSQYLVLWDKKKNNFWDTSDNNYNAVQTDVQLSFKSLIKGT